MMFGVLFMPVSVPSPMHSPDLDEMWKTICEEASTRKCNSEGPGADKMHRRYLTDPAGTSVESV